MVYKLGISNFSIYVWYGLCHFRPAKKLRAHRILRISNLSIFVWYGLCHFRPARSWELIEYEMESKRQVWGRPCFKTLARCEFSFLEGALARFPPSKIVQNVDKFDLARAGSIPAVGRALGFDSLPRPYIIFGCGGSALFGMGSLYFSASSHTY